MLRFGAERCINILNILINFHVIEVLSMPVFCDHDSNTAKAVQDGYALKLDLETLTSDILLKGIIKIIHDPQYRKAAK